MRYVRMLYYDIMYTDSLCLIGVGNFCFEEGESLETRVALLGIIIGSDTAVEKVNQVLHEYREDIVGRMGLPYPKQAVSIISIVLDAPQARISALSGKLGMISNVTAKTVYSKMPQEK